MTNKITQQEIDALESIGELAKEFRAEAEAEEKRVTELEHWADLQLTYQANIDRTKQTLLGLLMSDFSNNSMIKFYMDDLNEFFEGLEEVLQKIDSLT